MRFLAACVAGLLLAGCGGSSTRPPTHPRPLHPTAAKEADIDLLNGALAVEQRGIFAYEAADPMLSGFPQHVAGWFLGQELRHAGVLRELIARTGGSPHSPSPSYALGNPRTGSQLIGLLEGIEQAQIDAYVRAIPLISSGRVRATLASILADDAQHLTVLRAAQGLERLGRKLPRAARAIRLLRRHELRVAAASDAALRHETGAAAARTAQRMVVAAQLAALLGLRRHPRHVGAAVPTALVR